MACVNKTNQNQRRKFSTEKANGNKFGKVEASIRNCKYWGQSLLLPFYVALKSYWASFSPPPRSTFHLTISYVQQFLCVYLNVIPASGSGSPSTPVSHHISVHKLCGYSFHIHSFYVHPTGASRSCQRFLHITNIIWSFM